VECVRHTHLLDIVEQASHALHEEAHLCSHDRTWSTANDCSNHYIPLLRLLARAACRCANAQYTGRRFLGHGRSTAADILDRSIPEVQRPKRKTRRKSDLLVFVLCLRTAHCSDCIFLCLAGEVWSRSQALLADCLERNENLGRCILVATSSHRKHEKDLQRNYELSMYS